MSYFLIMYIYTIRIYLLHTHTRTQMCLYIYIHMQSHIFLSISLSIYVLCSGAMPLKRCPPQVSGYRSCEYPGEHRLPWPMNSSHSSCRSGCYCNRDTQETAYGTIPGVCSIHSPILQLCRWSRT